MNKNYIILAILAILVYFIPNKVTVDDFKNIAFGCGTAQVTDVMIYRYKLKIWCNDGKVLEFLRK